jgi:hypothetical protein
MTPIQASSHQRISVLDMKNFTNVYCNSGSPCVTEFIPGEGYWQAPKVLLLQCHPHKNTKLQTVSFLNHSIRGQMSVTILGIYSNQQIKFHMTEEVNYFKIFICNLLLSSAYETITTALNSTDVSLLQYSSNYVSRVYCCRNSEYKKF